MVAWEEGGGRWVVGLVGGAEEGDEDEEGNGEVHCWVFVGVVVELLALVFCDRCVRDPIDLVVWRVGIAIFGFRAWDRVLEVCRES